MSANDEHEYPDSLLDFMGRFVSSSQFQEVFEEGMRLVEETADYLDGPGRTLARTLSRDDAVAYATESMRLTTRLMQMASWLLLQRALAAGELSESEARQEQESINLAALAEKEPCAFAGQLPDELRAFAKRAQRLCERIIRLDAMIRARSEPPKAAEHPLSSLLARIEHEFGKR